MSYFTVLWVTWRSKPTAITLPLFMIITGIVAIVLGDQASKAFFDLGGSTLARVMGVCMLLGGLAVGVGIMRDDQALEPLGLTLTALGAMIYGCLVVLGLGTQGLITGIDHIAIAIGFLGRIALLLARAPKTGSGPPE
jgi:hypothetical protein